MGTDIQVKLFTDHLTVESPGTLPGTVRLGNLRTTHFSRNPKIAQVLHEYGFVREFGEGIDRIYREMTDAGLPAPEFKQNDFMLRATIKKTDGQLNGELNGELNESQKSTLRFIQEHPNCKASEISALLDIPFSTVDKHIRFLLKYAYIERRGSKKTGGYYALR